MTAKAPSPWQTLMLEITGVCLLIVIVGVGMFHQFTRWNLGGGDLIAVCVLIINYVALLRFQLSQASARIDELEKKVATSSTADA